MGGDGSVEGDTAQELAQARAALTRAREDLTLFAGQVGHDLRTPLTAVLANAEMLATEPKVAEDEELGWMVAAIRRGALRMDAMVEEMLGYARAGGLPVPVDTDLGAVSERVVDDLAALVEQAGATVVVEPLPTLRADPGQLHSVLLALLDNALRFRRPGTAPEVRVHAERRTDRWRVCVTDNGPGVPPGRQESVFVPFTQLDKRLEGSGIGLATVKRVVEAHGGRVGLESGPDEGTTVWFELPG
jgi:signal transduction histidine kinase